MDSRMAAERPCVEELNRNGANRVRKEICWSRLSSKEDEVVEQNWAD